jgi:hypothetical protein
MEKPQIKDLQSIYNQCLRLVKRKPPEFFLFRRMRECHGICDYENEVLEFDHRKEFIRTAYHECVHYLYPDWSETKVLYIESRLINNITLLDTTKFLMHLSAQLYKSELSKSLRQKRSKKMKKNKNKRVVNSKTTK